MKLHIEHATNYAFTEPVNLYPHILRFKPRSFSLQQVEEFSLSIVPEPIGFVQNFDGGSNDVHHAWFLAPTDHLDLLVNMEVETHPDNPLDFIIYPFESTKFPIVYGEGDQLSVGPFLQPIAMDEVLIDFCETTSVECNGELLQFVLLLTEQIFRNFRTIVRETGEPLEPAESFRTKEGSCRDLAFLAIAIFRYKGIASRFVSGYQYVSDNCLHDLHAWVEVYFPGGGWRGFDMTTGRTIDERYVRVSAGAAHTNTLPVTGAYGGIAKSQLRTAIRIWKQ